MKNLGLLFLVFAGSANAQWAVYDKKVHDELKKINNVRQRSVEKLKNFEKFEFLDVDFSKLSGLTDEEKKKFIGTVEDCGDEKLNANHFQACVGLRNLRLQTLKQSQSVLAVLDARRKSIDDLIAAARQNTEQHSGIMQRYHFELQGMQAQMQADALKLQVLMDGYRQREKVYETQMAEARRATDTRSPNALLNFGSVPFVKPPN